MADRDLKHWFKFAFKLLVSPDWESIADRVEDGDVTYRWVKEQLITALKKIESDYWQKMIASAASNLVDRLRLLRSSLPEDENFQQTAYWLNSMRGKSVLKGSSDPDEHRIIGAKLGLLEVAFVYFDEPAKLSHEFASIIDALYDVDSVCGAIDEKNNPELAAKVKIIYDSAIEFEDSMSISRGGDWIEMEFTDESLPKESPPAYCPPETWVFGNFGTRDGEFYYPEKVQIDLEGNFLVMDQNVIGEGTVQRLQLFSPKGKFIKVILKRGDGKVNEMRDFCLDKDGKKIIVCDCDPDDNARIMVFDFDGNQELSINVSLDEKDPNKYHRITSICTDSDGLIYGQDISDNSIQVYNPDGKLKLKFGEWGQEDGKLIDQQCISVNDGKIYASSESKTQIFDNSGNFLGLFGSSVCPSQLLFDAANNQEYAVYHDDHKIVVYDMDGNKVKETEGGFGTDLENFWFPGGIAKLPDGRLVVAERENHRVKVFKL